MSGFALACVILGVVAVVVVLIVLKKKAQPFETIEQDTLTMKEVIAFFKQTEVLNILKNNKSLMAVAIREKLENGKIHLILTIFNETKNDVVNTPETKAYIVQSIDSDLEQSFGNKDMLILK